jgi:hypothetical protein
VNGMYGDANCMDDILYVNGTQIAFIVQLFLVTINKTKEINRYKENQP